MKNSQLQRIIELWMEDPLNKKQIKELEENIDDPEVLVSFKQLHNDFSRIAESDYIPENPFFFSKLKYKMEKRKEEKSHVQRVRWAVYTATLSLSIVIGVTLGKNVEDTTVVDSSVTASAEEIIAQEFLVEDYSIGNTLLLEIEE